jgi:single-strand DNA-binding protein
MSDTNRVILIGRLTAQAELRHIPSGAAVTDFTLASNHTYGSGDSKKEEVSFFKCVAWSKAAELIVQWTDKGHRICVEGRLKQNSFEDKEGNKRSNVEVIVDNFQFLQPKGDQQGYENQKQSPAMGSDSKTPFDESEIPFNKNIC